MVQHHGELVAQVPLEGRYTIIVYLSSSMSPHHQDRLSSTLQRPYRADAGFRYALHISCRRCLQNCWSSAARRTQTKNGNSTPNSRQSNNNGLQRPEKGTAVFEMGLHHTAKSWTACGFFDDLAQIPLESKTPRVTRFWHWHEPTSAGRSSWGSNVCPG